MWYTGPRLVFKLKRKTLTPQPGKGGEGWEGREGREGREGDTHDAISDPFFCCVLNRRRYDERSNTVMAPTNEVRVVSFKSFRQVGHDRWPLRIQVMIQSAWKTPPNDARFLSTLHGIWDTHLPLRPDFLSFIPWWYRRPLLQILIRWWYRRLPRDLQEASLASEINHA